MEDEGLSIVFSPVQFAAALTGETLDNGEHRLYRFFGTLQLFGSAIELVAGGALLLVPEPTLVTKAGGVVLVAHGSDSAVAAAKQIWTGRPTKDLTQQAGEALAQKLGASQNQSEWAGIALDIAVPVGVSAALVAERVFAVESGRISLVDHESTATQKLGHTIQNHVGLTQEQLLQRLKASPRMEMASTFRSLEEAENAVNEVMKANKAAIRAWAESGKGTEAFRLATKRVTGQGLERATGKLKDLYGLRVVLRKTNLEGRVYFILTAFPE